MKRHVILAYVLLCFALGCAPESVDPSTQKTLMARTQPLEDKEGKNNSGNERFNKQYQGEPIRINQVK